MSILPNPGQEIASLDFASLIGGPLTAAVNAQAKSAMTTVNFIKEVGFNKATKKQGNAESSTLDPIYVRFQYPKEVEPYRPAVPAKFIGIKVTNPGSGYTSPPTVTITGDGAGAEATAVLGNDGKVVSVTLTKPGTGYKTAPTVAISGDGTGAAATAEFEAGSEAQAAKFEMMMLEVPILTMLPIPYLRIEEMTIGFNAKINSMEWAQIDTSLDTSGEVSVGGSASGFTASLKATWASKLSTSAGTNVERTYDMSVHVKAVQSETPAGLERILGILEEAIRAQPVNAPKPVQR